MDVGGAAGGTFDRGRGRRPEPHRCRIRRARRGHRLSVVSRAPAHPGHARPRAGLARHSRRAGQDPQSAPGGLRVHGRPVPRLRILRPFVPQRVRPARPDAADGRRRSARPGHRSRPGRRPVANARRPGDGDCVGHRAGDSVGLVRRRADRSLLAREQSAAGSAEGADAFSFLWLRPPHRRLVRRDHRRRIGSQPDRGHPHAAGGPRRRACDLSQPRAAPRFCAGSGG